MSHLTGRSTGRGLLLLAGLAALLAAGCGLLTGGLAGAQPLQPRLVVFEALNSPT